MSRIRPDPDPGFRALGGTSAGRTADKDREVTAAPEPVAGKVAFAMARLHRRMGDGLAVLAGARPDVLTAVPGARARFIALGGVLLSTGALAVLSAAFAVHMALGVWWPFALLCGVGWGAVVVNLDR